MVIGNSLAGALGGGPNSGYVTPAGRSTSGNAAPSRPSTADRHGPSSGGGSNGAQVGGYRVQGALQNDGGIKPADLHQTARIMALVASMRHVDDVSAYSLFGRNEGESDQQRHVISAYRENFD